jgi:predicted methyltransferase
MGCSASKGVEPTQPDPGPNQRPKTEVGACARDTHVPLTPEVRASSEEHSAGKGVSIEALQLLSQLDEQKLIRALESEDIRLGCREWLLAQPDDYRLQKR